MTFRGFLVLCIAHCGVSAFLSSDCKGEFHPRHHLDLTIASHHMVCGISLTSEWEYATYRHTLPHCFHVRKFEKEESTVVLWIHTGKDTGSSQIITNVSLFLRGEGCKRNLYASLSSSFLWHNVCSTADFLFSFCFACLPSFHSMGSKCTNTALCWQRVQQALIEHNTKRRLSAAVNHGRYKTWYTSVMLKKPAALLNRSWTPPTSSLSLSLLLEKERKHEPVKRDNAQTYTAGQLETILHV